MNKPYQEEVFDSIFSDTHGGTGDPEYDDTIVPEADCDEVDEDEDFNDPESN